jgi:cytochrome c oxidase cbb3-type subunit 3
MSQKQDEGARARSQGEYADPLMDHNYDGIQEYDNPLPTWWTLTLYATIAWAAVYFVGIGVGLIPTYEEDLKEGQAELAQMRQRYEDSQPKVVVTEELLASAIQEGGRVEAGAKAFGEKCAACHGDKGQGLIGPNLTDRFWLHGGGLVEIHKVIDKGVTEKGMPAWGGILNRDELVGVVGYIQSLQGSNPEGAKEPQGSPYEPKAAGETEKM